MRDSPTPTQDGRPTIAAVLRVCQRTVTSTCTGASTFRTSRSSACQKRSESSGGTIGSTSTRPNSIAVARAKRLRYNGYRVDNPLALLEPAVNLRVAAEVLRECGKTYRDTFSKVACYYSGDVDAAGHSYATQVFRRAGLQHGARTSAVSCASSTQRRTRSFLAAAPSPDVSVDDAAFMRALARTAGHETRVIVLDGMTP